MRQRSRAGIAIVLVVALLLSAGARYWADSLRASDIPDQGTIGAGTSLSNMNSFALGLLLGGLRGPLVMILWIESENEKTDKNLEDVNTQIEWIRLLQPEFDTVHIFEIWNKAYNLSVQMTSLANKYDTILSALDYANEVARQKPDDINIITAIAQVYGEKLGNSSEKTYYRRRVRRESKPHEDPSHLRHTDPGWHRTEMDPILNAKFDLLPKEIKPAPGHTARPANLPADKEWNTGAPLQYLVKFEPFPDGVSPIALGYNYYKRAEVLETTYGQAHAQLSPLVIDSRPALALKQWLEAEWAQGRRREIQAFGMTVPTSGGEEDRPAMENLTAGFGYDRAFSNRHDAELAEFAYRRAADLLPVVVAEYDRHLRAFTQNAATYRSHVVEARCEAALCAGDADYLEAGLVKPSARQALLVSARSHYINSIYDYERMILRYYTDLPLLAGALPPGFERIESGKYKGVEQLDPEQLARAVARVARNRIMLQRGRDSHDEDTDEFDRYMLHARLRLTHLRTIPGA